MGKRNAARIIQSSRSGTTKKTTETFHLVDTSIVSMESFHPADFHVIRTSKNNKGSNPQVLLGRPFLKTTSFRLNYYDETFPFEVENVIEIFQPTRPSIPKEGNIHHCHEDRKEESVGEIKRKETSDQAVIPKQKKERKIPTPTRRSKQKKVATKTVKKKKPERGKKDKKT
ncbi:hypothetical protein PIB30_089889 [Stylosanthes scabra]|uniref:Reverse transcriptase domain-containing protein n=1 Tax=Stylosanthes scabra TaxID=79078 RepID=A0ABU6YT25_9FABA|nr:hypothetical protein [Stylosanthes scabra]